MRLESNEECLMYIYVQLWLPIIYHPDLQWTLSPSIKEELHSLLLTFVSLFGITIKLCTGTANQ